MEGWDPRLREVPSLVGVGREGPPGLGGEIVPKEAYASGGVFSRTPPHANTSSSQRGVQADVPDSVGPILVPGLCHMDLRLVHPPCSITWQGSPSQWDFCRRFHL